MYTPVDESNIAFLINTLAYKLTQKGTLILFRVRWGTFILALPEAQLTEAEVLHRVARVY